MKCSWCTKNAVGEVELRKGSKKRLALMVPACQDHLGIVDRQTPFYTCGCHYIEGELKCLRHMKALRSPWREKLRKVTIKHSDTK